MTRILTVGAAQLGPVARDEPRQTVVHRLLDLMKQAHQMGCDLVVYPELALTTFFPRWYMESPQEVDQFFETEMPSQATQPLFDLAQQLSVGFCLGYAERSIEQGSVHHYNTSILVGTDGQMIGKYRKVHLPGHADYEPHRAFQHLEKRYFEVGNFGFPVWRAFWRPHRHVYL
jgi:predicted amidohydrolase